MLTRVGYTIQTIISAEVAPLFVGFCLVCQQEWRRSLCAAAGDDDAAAAATSEPDAFPACIWDTPATAMGMYLFYKMLVDFIVRAG